MLLPTFLSTATLALTATAFLVPTEVSDKAVEASNRIAYALSSPSILGFGVALGCHDCPFAQNSSSSGRPEWTENVASTLLMTFTSNGNQILLNGVPFYPVQPTGHPIKVKQVLAPGQGQAPETAYEGELGLSYSLEVTSRQPIILDASMVQMSLQILGIEDKMVNVNAINIQAMESGGEITLQKVQTAIPAVVDNCTTILCKVKAIIISKIILAKIAAMRAAAKISQGFGTCMAQMGFRPAHRPQNSGMGMHGGGAKYAGKHDNTPAVSAEQLASVQAHTAPSHGHKDFQQSHHHHGHRHGMKKFLHAVLRVCKTILIPILIGIAAGMAASAIGMLVGQIVVLLWMRYRRSHGATYHQVEQLEEVDEALPKYEDEGPLPEYEDVEGEKNIDVEVEARH